MNFEHISLPSRLSSLWLLRVILKAKEYAFGKLLDVGCGKKPYREIFNVEQYIGVDWANTPHGLADVDIVTDASKLPFDSELFDTVLCTEVLEHVQNPYETIREIARVLKPGGILILSTPFAFWIHEAPFDFFRYSVFGLRNILGSNDFVICKEMTRGGILTLLVDISIRYVYTISKKLLNFLKIPNIISKPLLFIFIGLPQHILAAMLFFIHDRLPRFASLIDNDSLFTLGYLIIAKKKT